MPHPAHIFDVVLERVREYQATRSARAIRPDAEHTGGGPVKVGNVPAEYVADFERAGLRVITNPHRLNVFILYYCQAVPFREAIELTGLRESTFKSHTFRIRTRVGKELLRAGLYPPRLYHEKHTNRLTAEEMQS